MSHHQCLFSLLFTVVGEKKSVSVSTHACCTIVCVCVCVLEVTRKMLNEVLEFVCLCIVCVCVCVCVGREEKDVE